MNVDEQATQQADKRYHLGIQRPEDKHFTNRETGKLDVVQVCMICKKWH